MRPLCAAVIALSVLACTGPTVDTANASLELRNGVLYFNASPFSGVLVTSYTDGGVKVRTPYEEGLREGLSRSYYPTGTQHEVRSYRADKAWGRHRGWWPDGKPRFDFTYEDDRREGIHKQWYVTGALYTELSYVNDREDGMQRAFRENGRPFINYETREGRRYGLAKSALCTSLIDGKEAQ